MKIRLPRYHRTRQWHRWFAWHPVRIGQYWIWLEIVERQFRLLGHPASEDGQHWVPEYREVRE